MTMQFYEITFSFNRPANDILQFLFHNQKFPIFWPHNFWPTLLCIKKCCMNTIFMDDEAFLRKFED